MEKQTGFTVIEMLVVLFLLGIIVGGLYVLGHFIVKFW